MRKSLAVPILNELVPEGFDYGCIYLVEFDPDSLWYETSLSIAALSLRLGVKTEYHTYMHPPERVRQALTGLGLDLKLLEEKKLFRIMDTYTGQTGITSVEESPRQAAGGTFDLTKPFDFTVKPKIVRMLEEGIKESGKGWLHIDDDGSILNRYFPEQEAIKILHTRFFPYVRLTETLAVHAVLRSGYSDSFLKQLETHCDGIIEVKSREEAEQIQRYIRVRALQGRACDSRWRRLTMSKTGMVKIDPKPINDRQLGIRGWISGPKN